MSRDAPDYTLLSDVEITGTEIMVAVDLQGATVAMPIDVQGATIALPVDIQGQTINLDVNLVASEVTIDVSIKAQEVNVKIITPSGIPVYIGTSFVNKTETGVTIVNAGSESGSLLNLTGRGRLISIAFWLRTGDPDNDSPRSDLMDNEIRIYVDGSSTPQVTITMEELDRLNGHQIWGQAINAGASTPKNYTAPLGPRGGLGFVQKATYITVDGFQATRVCGLYKCDVEFTTGLVVKWYNPDSVNLSVSLVFEYGHYPGGE